MKPRAQSLRKRWWSRGFTVHLQKDPPGKSWAPHQHAVDEIVRRVDGPVEIHVGAKRLRPRRSTDIVIPKKTVHWIRNHGPVGSTYFYGFRSRIKNKT